MNCTPSPRDRYRQLDAALEKVGTTGAHYRVFFLVAAGSLFNVIEQYNAGYAAPVLREQWGLSATAVNALSTATFLAMALGAVLSGFLADRYGRKYLFMVNVALYTAGSLLAALAPGYAVLLLARLVIGFGLGGEMALGYTLVTEIMATKVRGAMTSGMAFVASGIGGFAAAGLAALLLGPLSGPLGGEGTAWRWLFGVMFVPALLILFYRRYIPETPRYLLRRGEVAEVNRTLSKLAAGRLRGGAGVTQRQWISVSGAPLDSPDEDSTGIADLLRPTLRTRTLVAWALTFSLFGITTTFSIFIPALFVERGVPVDVGLLYTTIANFAGLLGAGVGVLGAQYVRRRLVYTVGGLALLVIIAALVGIPVTPVTLALAAAMQFTLQVINSTNWCYLPELFPTSVRASGAGSAATIGMVAAGLGPLASGALLDAYGVPAVFALLAGLAVVLGVASRWGPETRGAALMENTEALAVQSEVAVSRQ